MKMPRPLLTSGDLRANHSTPMQVSRALKHRNNRTLVCVQAVFTRTSITTRTMPNPCRVLPILILLSIPSHSALAADPAPHHAVCLSKAEQRAAVAANRAISLGQAIKLLREQ